MARKGRTRKAGDRYECGKLKPQTVDPNERVVSDRRALLGDNDLDIAKASDPLDFAQARGFLTMERFRSAAAFADAYSRSGIARGEGQSSGAAAETSTTTRDEFPTFAGASRNQWDRMSRKQITAAFDQVFNVSGPPDPALAARALARWKALNEALTPGQRAELFSVCVRRSWPQWMIYRAAGKDVPERWDRSRLLLEDGLDAVESALRTRRAA